MIKLVLAGLLLFGTRCSRKAVVRPPDVAKSIIPANIAPQYGVLTDYLVEGEVRTNLAKIQCTYITPPRENALMSLDIITKSLVDDRPLNIESFDLKVMTFTRLSDGLTQDVQMWAQVGNKNSEGTLFPLHVENWNGELQAYVYFDLNGDGQPNDGTVNSFRVTIPDGIGIPHTFQQFYDQPYIINVWFHQESNRETWAAWHQLPRVVDNPHWQGTGGTSKLAAYYEEAFWDEIEGFSFGSSQMGVQPDGQIWPVGPFTYGASESQAKGLTEMWFVNVTSPTQWQQYAIESIAP